MNLLRNEEVSQPTPFLFCPLISAFCFFLRQLLHGHCIEACVYMSVYLCIVTFIGLEVSVAYWALDLAARFDCFEWHFYDNVFQLRIWSGRR